MSLPSPKSTVVFREVPEGAILFCTATETYFSLNAVGVQVWRLLHPTCVSIDQVVERLSAEHPDATADVLRSDIAELLRALLESGLVELPKAA